MLFLLFLTIRAKNKADQISAKLLREAQKTVLV